MTAPELPPLPHIERTVQDRATALALDLSDPAGEPELDRLITEEIERWNDDHRRGIRATALADPVAVHARVFRNIARHGPLTTLLEDDDVWEIMINAPDAIFVKRHVGPDGYHDEVFADDDHVARTLTRLLDVASSSHRKLDPTDGLQDAQLDDGARLHIVHGDLSRGGHLMVNIRKFTGVAIRSLDQLVQRGTLDAAAARFLSRCVRARRSIVFAGAPGSGKTTLLSCCAAELDPSLRVVIAEEVFEADVPLANVASMQTRPGRTDRPEVDLRRLVSGFLRMAPDVAIVGEVRDREALPLLLTLSSGVTGFTTIHAGSACAALTRLRFICQLADTGSQLPMAALNSLVSEAVDVVVHSERGADGPRVTSIVAVEDQLGGAEATQFTVTELFERVPGSDRLGWTGQLPGRLSAAFDRVGLDLRDALGADAAITPGPITVIALAIVAAGTYGVFLVYTAFAYGWSGVRPTPTPDPRRRLGTAERVRTWMTQAGLSDVSVAQFVGATGSMAVAGGAVGVVVFGSAIPAAGLAAFGATWPVAAFRARRRSRRDLAQEVWPQLVDEIRILTGPAGRSIPNALFEAGAHAPEELRRSFDAARREWLLTTDFERTVGVLERELASPVADAVCETLLAAHQTGGHDLDRRLADLAEDRRQDTRGRKDARAEQAGVRFARRFVLLVPLGMALAGMSLGTGRDAYRTPVGQGLVIAGIAVVVACWVWSGRALRLPLEERVFG